MPSLRSWTRGLTAWYARSGRHDLPWRGTREPWPVLVSEVMLQQTQVRRVQPKWELFIERWPDPAAFAAAPLDDVLRAWQGLGYPRRAVALHRAAGAVAANGWPRSAAGLRLLPGVGDYTARALMVLAFGRRSPLPIDVNIGRVVARAAFGAEPAAPPRAAVEQALKTHRPPGLSARHYTLALFDVGALYCRASPRCEGCPLAGGCAARRRPPTDARRIGPRRQAAYRGSTRELRGRVLRAVLEGSDPMDAAALRAQLPGISAAASPGAVEAAVTALAAEGLITLR